MSWTLSSFVTSAAGTDVCSNPLSDTVFTNCADTQVLFSSLYSELHRLARRELSRRMAPASLSVTTLLHEAYIDMSARAAALFPDQARFFGYAARVMRGIIIDHARRGTAMKRGGAFEITPIQPIPSKLPRAWRNFRRSAMPGPTRQSRTGTGRSGRLKIFLWMLVCRDRRAVASCRSARCREDGRKRAFISAAASAEKSGGCMHTLIQLVDAVESASRRSSGDDSRRALAWLSSLRAEEPGLGGNWRCSCASTGWWLRKVFLRSGSRHPRSGGSI